MNDEIRSEQWQQLEELFGEALELPMDERTAFLDHNCGADPALRRQVERLIAADGKAGSFLAQPAIAEARPFDRGTVEPAEPRSIGPYRLVRKIGTGGMSDVWLAVRSDPELRRRVAIKCLRRSMATEELRRRSRREQQILASLDHPNIARLHEVGTTADGLPYFIMEYIEGEPITDFCAHHHLSIAERLELFRTVCSAVHHAHQNLIVHRDIKPTNILVTEAGVPKLLDFGIAKWLNPELTSQHLVPTVPWQLFLTPDYASPEQIEGKVVTTASDVYSLGVVLFELVTGERRVRSAARPPQEVGRRLAGDLDTIVAKALREEPNRRYASAHQLAEDIRRHLEGRPVTARKPTFRYRAGRFLRRHRVAAALVAAFMLALLISVLGLGRLSIRLERQGALLRQERDHARLYADVLNDILKTSDPFEGHGVKLTAEQILREGAETLRRLPDHPAEVKAELLDTIGNLYRRLGLNTEAEPLLRSALRIRTEGVGSNDPTVAASLESLGSLHIEMGDYAAAEACQRRALEIRRARLGQRHPEFASGLLQLALAVGLRGRYQESEALSRQALALTRSLPGDHQEAMASALDRLGDALFHQDRLDEAEALHREALAIFRQIHGSESLAVGGSLNNLSIVLQKKGEYDEAERLIREALAISRHLLGEEHRTTITNLTNLAHLAAFRGDYTQAESLYAEVLESGRRHLGPEHPSLAYLLIGLGSSRTRLGRPQEGEKPLREALALWQRHYSPEHFLIARVKLSLGECLLRQGRYEEAEAMLTSSYRVIAGARPPRELEETSALRYLVDLYTAWGKPKTASEYRQLLPSPGEP